MIKNQMTFPLAIDTATVKATSDVGYSATDAQLEAYTIGYIPWEMIEKSMFFKGSQIGTLKGKDENNQNNYFGYTPDLSFETTKGVPFCYSYAQNAYTTSLNAYRDSNDDYVTAPWGAASTAGIIHSYDVNTIITTAPNAIEETTGIYALFEMFVLYVPDGVDTSEGVWSTPNGENGWVTRLQEKSAIIDTLNLTFSVTSSTDSSYMPNPVTFTEADLTDSVNGVMVKENGTASYGGVTYHIYVHCAIKSAFLYDDSSMVLKDGIVQLNGIRFANFGYSNTPYYASVAAGYVVQNVFTCGLVGTIDLPLPNASGYYLKTSDDSYEYFKGGSTYLNNLVCGGFTITDLKIIRSVARPVYKISGSFYVAEFNDDYTITGNLIPYAQARTWQTFINPDNNVFDYNDIPEPPEPGENDDAFSGEEFAPIVNYRIGTAAGFITLYALTENQLAAFGAALWSTPAQDTFWQSIGVMLTTDLSVDPAHILDYIVSIRKYPLNLANLTNIYHTGTPGVYLGRGISGISVGGNVGYLDSYSCDVYGGSEKVPAEFNDFRDYEPYTKVSMYVPFCGTVELTPSQVVGKDIILQYVIDFSNGVIQANVIVSGEKGLVTLAVLSGKIGADVQATADNQIGQLQKISSIGHSIASTGIRMVAASQTGDSAIDSQLATSAASVSGQNSITGSFLSSVMAHNLNSNEGFSSFSMLSPCIFVERKHFNVPPNYGHTHGYACNVTTTLGDLEGKGFTVCGNVDLSGVPATQDELAALEALLQSGVYL